MKKYLALVVCGLLLSGNVAAQTSAERKAQQERGMDILKRAGALLREAESRAMEQCSTTRVVVPLPDLNFVTKTERTVDTIVSIEWSGACVDGKRDGDGALTWIEEKTTDTRIDQTANLESRIVTTWRSEGRFVKGQRLGLWCMTRKFQITSNGRPSSDGSDSGCSVFAGHDKQLTPNYRKQSDGSWMHYVAGTAGGSFLAPGTLEAQSAKVLADAAAGNTMQAPELVVQNRALDDLVRGAKIVLVRSAAPISLKDKRVAVVFSSQMLNALEQFKRERQALIDASAELRGEAADERAKFMQFSNPDRLLVNIAKVLKMHTKDAQFFDDSLADLAKAGFDYALVLDWKSMTRFDLLGKYDSSYPKKGETPVPACESWAAFLVTPELKAVKELPAHSRCSPKDKDENGNFRYMLMLSNYFQYAWGKSPDDAGGSISVLNYFLK